VFRYRGVRVSSKEKLACSERFKSSSIPANLINAESATAETPDPRDPPRFVQVGSLTRFNLVGGGRVVVRIGCQGESIRIDARANSSRSLPVPLALSRLISRTN